MSTPRHTQGFSPKQLAQALAHLQQAGHVAPEHTLDSVRADWQLLRLVCSSARQHAAAARAQRMAQRRRYAFDAKALAAGNDN